MARAEDAEVLRKMRRSIEMGTKADPPPASHAQPQPQYTSKAAGVLRASLKVCVRCLLLLLLFLFHAAGVMMMCRGW